MKEKGHEQERRRKNNQCLKLDRIIIIYNQKWILPHVMEWKCPMTEPYAPDLFLNSFSEVILNIEWTKPIYSTSYHTHGQFRELSRDSRITMILDTFCTGLNETSIHSKLKKAKFFGYNFTHTFPSLFRYASEFKFRNSVCCVFTKWS